MQKLGQHFLRSKRVLDRIVRRLQLEEVSVVVEIGPGEGIMTRSILEKLSPKQKLVVIEKDRKYAARLINDFEKDLRVEVVHGDVLKELSEVINGFKKSYLVVGNIPYYITGKLLRLVGEIFPKPKQAVFLVQKEVGERVCSLPPRMNRLAASIRIWAEPKIVAEVARKYFSPPPKVDSVVLEMVPHPKQLFSPKETDRLLRIVFQQPRKTVMNNVVASKIFSREEAENIFEKIGIDLRARPQDLSIKDLAGLATFLNN